MFTAPDRHWPFQACVGMAPSVWGQVHDNQLGRPHAHASVAGHPATFDRSFPRKSLGFWRAGRHDPAAKRLCGRDQS
jgi:hypothetical protein